MARSFEVESDALVTAAGSLNGPVDVLSNTRQAINARQVPDKAFANVAASHATGAQHLANINTSAQQLATQSDALRQLIDDVTVANQRFREFDEKKAAELGPKEIELAQADTGTTTSDRLVNRDQANRDRISQLLAAERENLANATERDRAGIDARINGYERLLATDVTLLNFDPAGNGRVVALVGDINANTGSVGVLVPGMGSGLHNFDQYKDIAGSFAIPEREGGGTAMVVWMDGDFPANLGGAASPEAAQDMAPRLRDFVNNDLRAMTGEAMPVTVIGHSYGGAVVGLADAVGMQANNVVHVESAGMGTGVTVDALNPDVARYSVTSPHDPISYSQGREFWGYGHGADPDTFPGVTMLHHGRDVNGTTFYGVEAHYAANVLGRYSDSWRDVNNIITGGQVPAAPVRPGR